MRPAGRALGVAQRDALLRSPLFGGASNRPMSRPSMRRIIDGNERVRNGRLRPMSRGPAVDRVACRCARELGASDRRTRRGFWVTSYRYGRRPDMVNDHVDSPIELYLAYRIICVQRNNAMVFPVSLWVTIVSQTWVVLPRCTGFALPIIVPSLAVPKWLDLSSIVVKPVAPGGRFITHP